MSVLDTPTKQELQKFIEVLDQLDRFEAETRLIRGYGAFFAHEVQEQEEVIIKVRCWLMNLAHNMED